MSIYIYIYCISIFFKGRNIELKVSISELYGLILFALLQKQYWSGAKQLIETGCVSLKRWYSNISCTDIYFLYVNYMNNSTDSHTEVKYDYCLPQFMNPYIWRNGRPTLEEEWTNILLITIVNMMIYRLHFGAFQKCIQQSQRN